MDKDEISLREYELCQDDNKDQSRSYWIIFGLFMSASTASLGWIIPNVPDINHSLTEYIGLRIIVTVLAAGVVIIIWSLKRWLDRANFLIRTNYGRMHQIELTLGMFKSLRIYFIDKWYKARKETSIKSKKLSQEETKKINKLVWKEISEELSLDDFRKLCKYKNMFVDFCQRPRPEHKLPAAAIADKIMCILVSIWGLLILYLWLTPLIKSFLEGASS